MRPVGLRCPKALYDRLKGAHLAFLERWPRRVRYPYDRRDRRATEKGEKRMLYMCTRASSRGCSKPWHEGVASSTVTWPWRSVHDVMGAEACATMLKCQRPSAKSGDVGWEWPSDDLESSGKPRSET